MREFLTVLFFLPALSASAQTSAPPQETVEVDGNALVGVWEVDFPTWGRINYLGRVRWGPLQGNFCRVEQAAGGLTANCFPRPGRDGTISVDDAHFHMAWGTMMARIYMDGDMSSISTFDGHFGLKLSGVAIENPNLSHGQKLSLSASAPDTGGDGLLLTRLLGETSEGRISENIDGKSSFVYPPEATGLRGLAAIEAVIYLGTLPKPLAPESKETPQPDFYHVYDVEFANGHRLCGVHQRDDGVLDAFRCV